jgi:predicted RecB family endonuclease
MADETDAINALRKAFQKASKMEQRKAVELGREAGMSDEAMARETGVSVDHLRAALEWPS